MTSAKQVRAQYTQQFELEAFRQVKVGQAIAVVAQVMVALQASTTRNLNSTLLRRRVFSL